MKKSVTKKVFIDLDVYKDFVRLAKSNKIPAETYLGLLIEREVSSEKQSKTIIPPIETPNGVSVAPALAGNSPLVVGNVFGYGKATGLVDHDSGMGRDGVSFSSPHSPCATGCAHTPSENPSQDHPVAPFSVLDETEGK